MVSLAHSLVASFMSVTLGAEERQKKMGKNPVSEGVVSQLGTGRIILDLEPDF